MTPELFYRFALTEPSAAIEAFDQFTKDQRHRMVFNLFTVMLLHSFGGRIPTRREQRRAVRHLTRALGRPYHKDIKALVGSFTHGWEATGQESVARAYVLMIHIAAVACSRADLTDRGFHELVQGLVDLTTHDRGA